VAAAVAGIMTVEVAMIATMTEKVDMTGKRTRNQGDLVAMIQGVTEGHVPLGIVLETMIDMGTLTFILFLACYFKKKILNQKKTTKPTRFCVKLKITEEKYMFLLLGVYKLLDLFL
jgi:hypothetical protein